MTHANTNRLDRSNYTLEDALSEITLAEAILDGAGTKVGVTLWGRISDLRAQLAQKQARINELDSEAYKLLRRANTAERELSSIATELDKHTTFDKEFPLVMRVRGLVQNYAALAAHDEATENARNEAGDNWIKEEANRIAAERERDEARRALEPFAKFAEVWDGSSTGRAFQVDNMILKYAQKGFEDLPDIAIRLGDVRRARAILTAKEKKHEQK